MRAGWTAIRYWLDKPANVCYGRGEVREVQLGETAVYMAKMTDLERMRKALELIQKDDHATVRISILTKKGLGQFTFSPDIS